MTSQTPRTAKTFIPSDIAEAFVQFSRNGRWGTCCDCPRDTDGKAYPEFCANTERADHCLTVDELAAVTAPWEGVGFEVVVFGRPEGMTLEHFSDPGYKNWGAQWGAMMWWR